MFSPDREAATAEGPMLAGKSLEDELRKLLVQGEKLQAIKLYKERTGASLLDAKNAVEALARGQALPAAHPREGDAGDAHAAELLPYLRMGELREAIRLYRKRTGAGPREARRAVQSLARQHGVYDRESAWLTRGLLILIVVGAVALVAGGAAILWR